MHLKYLQSILYLKDFMNIFQKKIWYKIRVENHTKSDVCKGGYHL